MSQVYYQELWREAQDELKKSIAAEVKLRKKGPIKDPNTAKWVVGHLFIRYVRIVNTLDECYDQMVHPQKREVLGRLLDMSLGRLLELKSEIVRIENDDYCFFDNVLIELKLTHQDMEIHVPKYFWKEQEKAKAHRRELIRRVFEEAEREKFREQFLENIPEEEREVAWERHLAKEEQARLEREKFEEQQRKMQVHTGRSKDSLEILKRELREPEVDKESITEAIELIQRHERARQGRIETLLAKRRKKLKMRGEAWMKWSGGAVEKAAAVIQRHWRRHRRRLKVAKVQQNLQEMLGMTLSSYKDTSKYKNLEKVSKIRKKMQERNQAEYEQALVTVKEKVRKLYAVAMEEDIVDELMGWFQWYFEQSNYLPDFPPEKPLIPTGKVMGVPKKLGPEFADRLFQEKKNAGEKAQKMSALGIALAGISAIGGSALVVAGHWIGPKEFVICQKELEKRKKAGDDGKGGGGGKDKMSKEEKQALKRKEKELEKRRLLAEEAEGFRLKDSNFEAPLTKADRDYRVVWMDRDERGNKEQRYVYEFVKDEKCYELSMEVRKVVDEMMVLELELLKEALERDKNPKKKPKKKKPKKDKKEKKKKEKKDPTGDRTLDELFMELFKNGIIREYDEAHLKDYLGERSFGAFDMRQRLIDWPPSTGDVRELILQLCILPLGSSRIHQLSPLIRGVCLLGTENSGKEFLARIICTETAAVMFDLTPANVVGKYPGKDGLKMLQHLVEKMSRALQPSVIFVEGAEKTFYKKVPKEEKELDPKRLAKMITKTAKAIRPEDQVLLLGVSSQPWMAKKGAFLKAYQKAIQVPQMDYGSYMQLWQGLLAPYHCIPRDFDVSCLARISDGFSVRTIMDVVKNLLTTERISRSKYQPFTQAEFLEQLLKATPTDEKLKEKSLKFYAGLDLPKKRAKKLEELREVMEKAQKKK